jgi:hypothetical protein
MAWIEMARMKSPGIRQAVNLAPRRFSPGDTGLL